MKIGKPQEVEIRNLWHQVAENAEISAGDHGYAEGIKGRAGRADAQMR